MAGSPEFLSNLGARLKNSVVQRVIGAVAITIVSVTVAGVQYFSHASQNDAAAKDQKIAVHAPSPIRHAAPGLAAQSNAKDAAALANQPVSVARPSGPESPARSMNPKAVNARLAATSGNGAPVVTAVPTSGPAATAAHLDEHLTYQYNALGRRDPFQSLVDGQFVGVDVGGDAPPDPGGIKVVGIVWGTSDQFAMVEDVRGNSFVLRKGDKVQNGYVESLKRDGLVVTITADGQSQSVVIPLVKGASNAR